MKQPNFLLKLAALASSVLLVSGFVCYRAGAFHWLWGASPQPADADPSLFPGPKSGVIFHEPAPTQQPAPAGSPTVPTVMSGSKSLFIQVPNNVSDAKQSSVPPPSKESP